MTDFFLKRGDRLPVLAVTLYDKVGPVDLTGATVRFTMTLIGANVPTINLVVVTVTDAVDGEVEYTWDADDTLVSGTYKGEFEVQFPSGKRQTFPNDSYITISIYDDLA